MVATRKRETRKPTMIRIDHGLYEKLAVIARDEGRSVNQQIIFFIRQGLDREDVSTTAH